MNSIETRLHDARLGSAIENACKSLPEGWQILISLERDSGDAALVSSNGESVDFPSNRENLGDTIADALSFAREQYRTEAVSP